MAYVKFDPFTGFEQFARKMGDFAKEFEKGINVEYGNFSPKIDIIEDDKNIWLYAEIAGIAKDSIKVTVNEQNELLIKGNKKRNDIVSQKLDEQENKDESPDLSFIRSERRFGDFSRTFMLPDNINRDSIKAKYNEGVLEIRLDKKEPESPKEKEINID